jgi:hypothetical protein
MLVMLSALIVATIPALVQSAATPQAGGDGAPIVRSLTSRDSTRALRMARRAQGDFEALRRRLLPFEPLGRGGDCDATVGQYCYRQQFTSPPSEAPLVVAARARLLATLDSVGALIPGDSWILGQRVRYLMEAGRPLAADSVEIACAARAAATATASWCLALAGYTAQQLGNYPRADAAYTAALAEMPASDRCKWEDLALLLGRSAGPYRRGDCQARDSLTAGFWRLVQPLYLRNVNDLRTEFLARITRMYIEQGTSTPMGDWWGADDRDALLRYGVPLWYTRGEISRGDLRPQIAGFRREPSFNFFPQAHVFAAPDELSPTDWNFLNLVSSPTYAPRWANSFLPILDHQVALFRRGDSAFVVAAFDADDGGRAGDAREAGAFAAVIDRGGVLTPFGTTIHPTGLGVVSTLSAPWRPFIVSLEMLNPTRGVAGRARFAPRLPISSGRLSLSDLLLYSPRDSAPASLTEAIPRALHALRAPSNRQVGVFWEAYGARPEGERFDYALLVTPIDEGIVHRALVKLHLAEPERSLTLQWHEVPSAAANGIASRGVTVDLSHLRPGQYAVRLMLTSGTDIPVVAERSIEIL